MSSTRIEKSTNYIFLNGKNSESRKRTTFSDCVYEVHRSTRVYGLMPFSFARKNGEIVGSRVGVLDFFWFIVSLAMYGYLIYCTPFKVPWQWQVSPILRYEHYLQLTGGLIRIIFTILLDMYNRHRITRIVMDLIDFDKVVVCFSLMLK